jgi:predicted nucleotide-binding protein (sugar kinase/HSP70/actin superfamily)
VARDLRALAGLRVEVAWKRWIERRVRYRLAASGLVDPHVHPMEDVMRAVDSFASADLDSEAVLSPCAGRLAVEDGFRGIAVIAPFACLPGRIIEALLAPWARSRGVPIICLENDGNPYPANVVSRLELFATQASRDGGCP